MNINLPPELETYVRSLVGTGHYSEADDVIEAAVRQHQVHRPGFQVVMTPELERLLDEGLQDLSQSPARTISAR